MRVDICLKCPKAYIETGAVSGWRYHTCTLIPAKGTLSDGLFAVQDGKSFHELKDEFSIPDDCPYTLEHVISVEKPI